MNVSEVTAKAKVLLEALPYIQDFHGSTFVVKYGGSFMDDPDPVTRARVAFDIAFLAAVADRLSSVRLLSLPGAVARFEEAPWRILAAGVFGALAIRWILTRPAGNDAMKTIAAAIQQENFDLIVTGLQSDDFGAAQTGVLLAEILKLPHATIIIGIEKTDSGVTLKRELEAGHYQHIDLPLPAVLTIQSGINKLRYATLIGIKQAKMKPIRKVAYAEVEAKLSPNQQKIERLYVPIKQKKTEMVTGSSSDIAKKIVEHLKNHARVI